MVELFDAQAVLTHLADNTLTYGGKAGSERRYSKVSLGQASDIGKITATISEAFSLDPAWGWAFPDQLVRSQYWKFIVEAATRYPFVFKTTGFEAASVWIPPGGSELMPEISDNIDAVLRELAKDRAEQVGAFLHRFESHHPQTEPHFYLAMVGIANSARGLGLGMSLLRHNLALIDKLYGLPVYLESSNQMNNRKYESVGFQRIGEFRTLDDREVVTCMWRPSSPKSQ